MARHLNSTTLAAAATITLAYGLAIQLTQPVITAAPTVGLYNRVFTERYVYGKSAPVVLAGSSLTARMPAAELGAGVTNLALNGEGAMTGLAIVAKSPQAPRHIFIEINQVGLGSDTQILAQTFAEPGLTLRQHVAALRKSYQPITVLYGLMRGKQAQDNADRPMTPSQHAELVRTSARGLAKALPQQRLDMLVTEMRGYLAVLQARGTRPVFYEMPIDTRLRELPAPARVRQAMRAAFPTPDYCWIDLGMRDPRTMDGLHLTQADAALAARKLREAAPCAR